MIAVYPNKVLKTPCEEVSSVPEGHIETLQQVLRATRGLAIAANQIGVLERIIVLGDVSCVGDRVLLNPVIIQMSTYRIKAEERCLSFPGLVVRIKRSAHITIKYRDEEWREKEYRISDLSAVVLQHEVDHLNGITFIQRLNRIQRAMLVTKLKRMKRQFKV